MRRPRRGSAVLGAVLIALAGCGEPSTPPPATPLLGPALLVADAGTGDVVRIDPGTLTASDRRIGLGGYISKLRITGDGSKAVVLSQSDAALSVVDLRAGRVARRIEVEREVEDIGLSADGARVFAVGGEFNTLVAYRLDTGEQVGAAAKVGDAPGRLALSRDGGLLAVTSQHSRDVRFFDADTLAASGEPVQVGMTPLAAVFSPIGDRLYLTDIEANAVFTVDLGLRAVVGVAIPVGRYPTDITIDAAGGRIAVVNQMSDSLSLIDLGSRRATRIPTGAVPEAVAQAPDFRRLVVTDREGRSVTAVDTRTARHRTSPRIADTPRGIQYLGAP